MDFWRRQTWDLVGRSWIWFTLSGVLFVIGVGCWIAFGLNYGIDFTGGSLLQYKFAKPLATSTADEADRIAKMRDALGAAGLTKVEIQLSGSDIAMIRTSAQTNDEQVAQGAKAQQALETLFGQQYGPVEEVGHEMVGPIVGADLRNKAILALCLGSFLILIYITIRYEFRFAVAAVIALLHDASILTGSMALLRVELNSWFVAAILTVLGFSMHDTVIIMDRIRENRRLHRFTPFHDVVNASLLQTMTRSINTVLTVLLTLFALFIFGGETLRGFSLSLIIGIVLGAYSSIFNASQLVVVWDAWSRKRKVETSAYPRKAAAATTRSARAATPEGVTAAVAVNGAEGEAADESKGKVGALEAIRLAEEKAQEEKREERRERRKSKKSGGKRRF